MVRRLHVRLVVSFLILSQMILHIEGQSSYGLVGGATSISATSTYNGKECEPADTKYSNSKECWCSNTNDCSDNPILTINLGGLHRITRVGVKSCSWKEYLTSYKIQSYYAGAWTWYKSGQSLTGNSGCCTERSTSLSPIIEATHIRLYPLTAQSWCSTNFEVYGYPWTPTESPTPAPTSAPTPSPTLPTRSPTPAPTTNPTSAPTPAPTANPTPAPTANPTPSPTPAPTNPTTNPTTSPTNPTRAPTPSPTPAPTHNPTPSPTPAPTSSPTTPPTNAPSMGPTFSPTHHPTLAPSYSPTTSPTFSPTRGPTIAPTYSPTDSPTSAPTRGPTLAPTYSPTDSPTSGPTYSPTDAPTYSPTLNPTLAPTTPPTNAPSAAPSNNPSNAPTSPPTIAPSNSPTIPTESPSDAPTLAPSLAPTAAPTITWSLCTPNLECAFIAEVIFTIDWSAEDAFGEYLSDVMWVQTRLQHIVRMELKEYVHIPNTLIVVSLRSRRRLRSAHSIIVDAMIGNDDRDVIDALLTELRGSDDMNDRISTSITDDTQRKYKDSAFEVDSISVETKMIKPQDAEAQSIELSTTSYLLIVAGIGVCIALVCGVLICREYMKRRKGAAVKLQQEEAPVWIPGNSVYHTGANDHMLNQGIGSNSQYIVGEEDEDGDAYFKENIVASASPPPVARRPPPPPPQRGAAVPKLRAPVPPQPPPFEMIDSSLWGEDIDI
eukprot:699700_1